MPRYDFRCSRCGAIEEVELTMAAVGHTLLDCRRCGSPLERVFAVPPFLDRPTSPAIVRDPIARGIDPKNWNY